jgi:hypothetical protein
MAMMSTETDAKPQDAAVTPWDLIDPDESAGEILLPLTEDDLDEQIERVAHDTDKLLVQAIDAAADAMSPAQEESVEHIDAEVAVAHVEPLVVSISPPVTESPVEPISELEQPARPANIETDIAATPEPPVITPLDIALAAQSEIADLESQISGLYDASSGQPGPTDILPSEPPSVPFNATAPILGDPTDDAATAAAAAMHARQDDDPIEAVAAFIDGPPVAPLVEDSATAAASIDPSASSVESPAATTTPTPTPPIATATASHPLMYAASEVPAEDETLAPSGGGWTIAVLCAGLALIAACVIIPQADANRRLVYEREKLRLDLQQINEQLAVNKEFLNRVESDPQLAERLAQRQMKVIRAGTSELQLKHDAAPVVTASDTTKEISSPFLLLNVPPPAPLPPYRSVGGVLADWCRDPQTKLYLLGAGMACVAMGLVLGHTSGKPADDLVADAEIDPFPIDD